MKYFTKSRIKNILIIFLLISNLATIGTIAFHRYNFSHKSRHFDKDGQIDLFIKNEIGFSESQTSIFEKDKTHFMAIKDSLFKNLRQYKASVWKEYGSLNTDSMKLDSLSSLITNNFKFLNKASNEYYFKLLRICDQTQRFKLKEKYKSMSEEENKCQKSDD